ncbi:cag pathogenicity island protein, partial [Helicobacter pylori]
ARNCLRLKRKSF